jgi:hypothetical protein
MAASLLVNVGVKLLEIRIPHGISVGAISFLLSLVLFFGISLLSKPPDLDEDVRRVMDL